MNVQQMFEDARSEVRRHIQAGDDEFEDALAVIDELQAGNFNVDGDGLWDLWDCLGTMQKRTADLEQLYLTLGVMLKIVGWPERTLERANGRS